MNDKPLDASAPTGRRWRRRTYIVNPVFQWKYAALVVAGVFILCTLVSTILYGVLFQMARERAVHPTVGHALENTFNIVLFAALFALLMGAGFGLWSIVLTHRISGPLFVIRKCLEELAQGRLPAMRSLRRKDEFKDLYDTLRAAVEKLAQAHQDEVHTLSESLKLIQSAASEELGERQQALAALTRQIEQLREQSAAWLGASAGAPSNDGPDTPRPPQQPAELLETTRA